MIYNISSSVIKAAEHGLFIYKSVNKSIGGNWQHTK